MTITSPAETNFFKLDPSLMFLNIIVLPRLITFLVDIIVLPKVDPAAMKKSTGK